MPITMIHVRPSPSGVAVIVEADGNFYDVKKSLTKYFEDLADELSQPQEESDDLVEANPTTIIKGELT